MREYHPIESALYAAFDRLLESEALEIDYENVGTFQDPPAGVPEFFDTHRERRNAALEQGFDEATPWISDLACSWRTASSRRKKRKPLFGEFHVKHVYDCLRQPPPDLTWEGAPAAEKELASQLRVIDDTPRSGAGLLAAVRMPPETHTFEVWYYDKDLSRYPGHPSDFVRLDMSYAEYMRVLPITKGTFGWQYLFADVSLDQLTQAVANIEAMLDIFPDLFPEHDYAPLRARLEERL